MIKPVSAQCNLHCRYCFYRELAEGRQTPCSGAMPDEVVRRLIEAFMPTDQPVEVTFAFQGGEPMLAGLDYFKRFVALVRRLSTTWHQARYTIQTNGTLLDEAWCAFFKENEFLVGLSLDGGQEIHDALRKGPNGSSTFKIVMEAAEDLRRWGVAFNILTVLSRPLAEEPELLYQFYRKNGFRFVQLIPCLPSLIGSGQDAFSLAPRAFASFYQHFYRLWLEDYLCGERMSVALFDNLVLTLQGIYPNQCGMLGFCSPQFVIESDGSVYPCDFYAQDAFRCGNIKENTLRMLKESPAMQCFLDGDKILSALCNECKFLWMCGGNCKRMRSVYWEESFCGYKAFLEYAFVSLRRIGEMEKGMC